MLLLDLIPTVHAVCNDMYGTTTCSCDTGLILHRATHAENEQLRQVENRTELFFHRTFRTTDAAKLHLDAPVMQDKTKGGNGELKRNDA
jgi:hypothetical protein